jgi:hypothetical protein
MAMRQTLVARTSFGIRGPIDFPQSFRFFLFSRFIEESAIMITEKEKTEREDDGKEGTSKGVDKIKILYLVTLISSVAIIIIIVVILIAIFVSTSTICIDQLLTSVFFRKVHIILASKFSTIYDLVSNVL